MSAERWRSRRLALWALLALSLWLAPSSVHAGDKALAESLFVQARELMQAERYAEACPKLEQSNEQDPSAGTMLNLAICYEKIGRSASAWAMYKATIVRAKSEGRTQHADAATAAAARIEPELSKLTIAPTHPIAEGLSVKRGDVKLGRDSLGIPLAVDPGEYTIVASAPGYKDYSTKVTIGARGDKQVVDIPVLVKAPAAEASGAGSVSAPPELEPKGSKTLGYVLLGTGGALTLTGLVFGYLAQQQASEAEDDPTLCPDKRCTPAGREEIDAAETKALISTIGVGVGLVGIGAGIYFLVSSPSTERPSVAAARTRVVPLATPSGGGLVVSGSF